MTYFTLDNKDIITPPKECSYINCPQNDPKHPVAKRIADSLEDGFHLVSCKYCEKNWMDIYKLDSERQVLVVKKGILVVK